MGRMKETQREKIERIENENARLREKINSLYEELNKADERYYALVAKSDDDFSKSSLFKQMETDLLLAKENAKTYQRRFEIAESVRFKQAAKLEEFQNLIGENSVHNSRGAGRKPKLSKEDIQSIKDMRASKATIKEIADRFHCSVGLISKILRS